MDPIHLWLNRLRRLQSHLRKINHFLVAAVNTTAKLGVSRISMFYNKKMSKRLDVLFENSDQKVLMKYAFEVHLLPRFVYVC